MLAAVVWLSLSLSLALFALDSLRGSSIYRSMKKKNKESAILKHLLANNNILSGVWQMGKNEECFYILLNGISEN